MINDMQKNILAQKIYILWITLKLTYGLVPIVAGADKFFNFLAYWPHYLNPSLLNVIPLNIHHFMYIVGIIEIIAGILVLTNYTRYGAYLVMLWLILIALNLITIGYYDIAVRDIVMAVGAFTLAQLTEIIESK